MVRDDTSSDYYQPSRPLCFITRSHSPVLDSWRLTSLASAAARETTSAGNEAEHVACQPAGSRASKADRMKGWMKSWGVAACVVPAASRWWRKIKKQMIMSYQGEIEAPTVYVSNSEFSFWTFRLLSQQPIVKLVCWATDCLMYISGEL